MTKAFGERRLNGKKWKKNIQKDNWINFNSLLV